VSRKQRVGYSVLDADAAPIWLSHSANGNLSPSDVK
jgi:hypothetical protein